MASDYPTAIDPALPEIVNQFDALTPDVLQHVIDMLDGDALRRVIAAEQPAFVIPEIEAS